MRLYFDTSVFSAYVDERSPERMATTRSFWATIDNHELYCSTLTLDEIRRATEEKVVQRHELATRFHVIAIEPSMQDLAQAYVAHGVVSPRYIADALHIAAAVLSDADVIIRWNFEHLVKRGTGLLVNYVNSTRGLRAIEILAPPEL